MTQQAPVQFLREVDIPRSFVKVQEVQRNIHFSRVKLLILGACGSVTYLQIGRFHYYPGIMHASSECLWTFPYSGVISIRIMFDMFHPYSLFEKNASGLETTSIWGLILFV